MTSNHLTEELAQFIGSEMLFQHFIGIKYTEGVQHLAEHAGAYWLIDAIASHQVDAKVRSEPFQLWELIVGDDKSAELTVRRDRGEEPIVRQEIPFNDFPLGSIKLYAVGGVLMLPSEY